MLHLAFHLVTGPEGLRSMGIVEDIMEASIYLAAIAHDFEHPGLTNDFLIRSHDPLAILYNDHSPLENHHAARAFSVYYKHFHAPDMQVSCAWSSQSLTDDAVKPLSATGRSIAWCAGPSTEGLPCQVDT